MEASVLKIWRDYVNSLPAGPHPHKMSADVFACGDCKEMTGKEGPFLARLESVAK
jgi:hypothetical protein